MALRRAHQSPQLHTKRIYRLVRPFLVEISYIPTRCVGASSARTRNKEEIKLRMLAFSHEPLTIQPFGERLATKQKNTL